jgi:hypothetical protein
VAMSADKNQQLPFAQVDLVWRASRDAAAAAIAATLPALPAGRREGDR